MNSRFTLKIKLDFKIIFKLVVNKGYPEVSFRFEFKSTVTIKAGITRQIRDYQANETLPGE